MRGLVRRLDCAERARTIENACEGPDPTMNVKLLDSVSILSRINVAGLEIDAVRRVARTDGEGQGLCHELEFSCKLSLCQDVVRTGPGTILWADPGARDFDVVGDVLNGGEGLYHGKGKGGETVRVGLLAWF